MTSRPRSKGYRHRGSLEDSLVPHTGHTGDGQGKEHDDVRGYRIDGRAFAGVILGDDERAGLDRDREPL